MIGVDWRRLNYFASCRPGADHRVNHTVDQIRASGAVLSLINCATLLTYFVDYLDRTAAVFLSIIATSWSRTRVVLVCIKDDSVICWIGLLGAACLPVPQNQTNTQMILVAIESAVV